MSQLDIIYKENARATPPVQTLHTLHGSLEKPSEPLSASTVWGICGNESLAISIVKGGKHSAHVT